MTCNDCFHFEACKNIYKIAFKDNKEYKFTGSCKFYKASADVTEVKHEKWVEKYPEVFECTGCGYEWYLTGLKADPIANEGFYCPYCGAEMEVEKASVE